MAIHPVFLVLSAAEKLLLHCEGLELQANGTKQMSS